MRYNIMPEVIVEYRQQWIYVSLRRYRYVYTLRSVGIRYIGSGKCM